MIHEKLSSLMELSGQLNSTCVKQDPLIKLGSSNGNAPKLDYNIPQTSSFETYGLQYVKGVIPEYFIGVAKEAPPNNFFQTIENLTEEEIANRISQDVQLNANGRCLIPNANLLRKNINNEKSNLEAIALNKEVFANEEGVENTEPHPKIFEKGSFINEKQLSSFIKNERKMPYISETMGGFGINIDFIKEPASPNPYFMLIEEYKTCSFLSDYGAGRTLNTFSLLPGEKTTISVKTFRDKTVTKNRAENILDSYSENSTREFEKELSKEASISDTLNNSSESESSFSNNREVSANSTLSIKGIFSFGANGKRERKSAGSNKNTSNSTRNSNIKAVSNALDKHVAQSNSSRNIEVNTTTNETEKNGEESSTVRELVNLNKSRVLNIVFRQLLQQYVTITYLSNIKIAFCNGYKESLRIVDIEELEVLLEDLIEDNFIDTVRNLILKNYYQVLGFDGEPKNFVERFTFNYNQFTDTNPQFNYYDPEGGEQIEYVYRISKDNNVYATGNGGMSFSVPGPILNVETYTLKTDGIIAEALLGQGEALDCFNLKAQDAFVIAEQLKNLELIQKIELIERSDEAQANLYKKVFGTCCETPQSQVTA